MAFDPNKSSEGEKRGPLTGKLLDEADAAVKKPHEQAKVDALRDHNHSMAQADNTDTGSLSSGRIRTGAGVSMNAASVLQLKAKKEKEKAFREAGKRALEQLNEMLADLEKQIAEHEEAAKDADDFANRLKDGEQPEVGEDGKLKNKKDEKTISDWEKRTGKKADRTDRDMMLQIAVEQGRYNREQAADLKEWHARGKELGKNPTPEQVEEFQESFEGRQITFIARAEIKDADTRKALDEAAGRGEHSEKFENYVAANKDQTIADFGAAGSLADILGETPINGGKNITPEYNLSAAPDGPSKTAENTHDHTDAANVRGFDPIASG